MRILHLKKEDYATSRWSAGTTTQLYLYPEDGSYAQRRFQIRVSSAAVELEESDFTPLPGVDRWITPLAGGFTLTHPGREPVVMGPLQAPYGFSGGIETHCVGRAVDFNLMLQGAAGRMEIRTLSSPVEPGFNGFYPVADCAFLLEGRRHVLEGGELLVVWADAPGTILWDDGAVICCHAAL